LCSPRFGGLDDRRVTAANGCGRLRSVRDV
jgi:hypothetical protein